MTMPKYPQQYDDTSDATPPFLPATGDDTVVQEYVDRMKQSIIAIERELGINPSGTQATVAERLDLIDGGGGGRGDEEIPFSTTMYIPSAGDLVFIFDPGTGNGAAGTATADAVVPARCAAIGVATSVDGLVRINGIMDVSCPGIISAGDEVFLSETTPGAVVNVAPSAVGQAVVPIGIAQLDSVGGLCRVMLKIDRPEYIV